MGAVGGMLGLSGGAGGTGFSGPSAANLINPLDNGQISKSYGGAQDAMAAQQSLLQAIQNQQGLQNQSQVYNQLQGVANGTGPNPAQAMLNQSTGQNVSNQAALMAGQRGAGANVGLMARQAAQQGANIQQQAVGQGATMQAQQSLNALTGAGAMANTQAANQIGQTNANTSAQQSEQQSLLNAQAQYNSAQAGMQSNINSSNASLAGSTMGMAGSLIGGLAKGAAGAGMMALHEGGDVKNPKKMADGGETSAFMGPGPQSKFGQFLATQGSVDPIANTPIDMSGSQAGQQDLQKGAEALGKSLMTSSPASPDVPINMPMAGGPMDAGSTMSGTMFAAQGGKVPAMVSPGEIRIHAKDVRKVAEGKKSPLEGERIPGKPKVSGAKNSYANDTVPKSLNEGDIILPRSVTQSKHPHWAAHKFVSAIMANRKNGR